MPDLAFSEMKFLDWRPFILTPGEMTIPKNKKDQGSKSKGIRNEISTYFDTLENKSNAIPISSTYVGPKKRLRHDFKNSPEANIPKMLLPGSQSRPSPRSAMAEVLLRNGVYSLPANRSSNDALSIIRSSIVEGESEEYSCEGYQTRFKTNVKSSANFHGVRDCEGANQSSTGSHMIKPLDPAKKEYNERPRELYSNTVVDIQDEIDTNATIEQVLDTPESIKKSMVSRDRYTPEPCKIQDVSFEDEPFCVPKPADMC